ncbi:hypothetical protein ACIOEX_01785 [Streptomyces sp. NPDC087850]|uniref:hypothetical protein n=1 Tax=Streptomyces sp. NPDC087850 TaxID=3365809 RepID=UPI003821AD41
MLSRAVISPEPVGDVPEQSFCRVDVGGVPLPPVAALPVPDGGGGVVMVGKRLHLGEVHVVVQHVRDPARAEDVRSELAADLAASEGVSGLADIRAGECARLASEACEQAGNVVPVEPAAVGVEEQRAVCAARGVVVEEFSDGDGEREDAFLVLLAGDVEVRSRRGLEACPPGGAGTCDQARVRPSSDRTCP